MSKYIKKYAIVWVTLVAVYHVVIFLVPQPWVKEGKFSENFWIGYVVVWLALLGQFLCVLVAGKYKKLDKIFLQIPLLSTSYRALIVLVIIATACMFVPMVPVWVTIIACTLALAFSVISVVSAQTSGDIVSDIENKVKDNTYFIQSLTLDAEGLIKKSKDEETKKLSKKIYEAVRFSNLMSNNQLDELEKQIRLAFEEYSTAVENGSNQVSSMAMQVLDLLSERNRKCKLLK